MNREFPVEWVVRTLEKSGYIVDDIRLFPINWGIKALEKQLNVCEITLKNGKDRLLRQYIGQYVSPYTRVR